MWCQTGGREGDRDTRPLGVLSLGCPQPPVLPNPAWPQPPGCSQPQCIQPLGVSHPNSPFQGVPNPWEPLTPGCPHPQGVPNPWVSPKPHVSLCVGTKWHRAAAGSAIMMMLCAPLQYSAVCTAARWHSARIGPSGVPEEGSGDRGTSPRWRQHCFPSRPLCPPPPHLRPGPCRKGLMASPYLQLHFKDVKLKPVIYSPHTRRSN